ncbi:MAG: hypothetical protein JW929_05095 [Anaerolineales bacterium]|nr:hypothetical protein [Anaerolineales bacterium]
MPDDYIIGAGGGRASRIRPEAEQPPPDPEQGGAFLNGGIEIVRHPHGEFLSETIRQLGPGGIPAEERLAEERACRLGIVGGRSHRPQSDHGGREAIERPSFAEKGFPNRGVVRRQAIFRGSGGCFASGQDAEGPPRYAAKRAGRTANRLLATEWVQGNSSAVDRALRLWTWPILCRAV